MICVITGLPMFDQPPSPGLAETALELSRRHPSTLVLQTNWNDTPPDSAFAQNEPVLLIGHSFGGCTAVMLSRHLEEISKPVHLILIDPVRHQRDDRHYPIPVHDEPLAQAFAEQFDVGPNWTSSMALLRSDLTWLPPYHQGIASDDPGSNLPIPRTDHNSIIRSPVVQTLILSKAAALFD